MDPLGTFFSKTQQIMRFVLMNSYIFYFDMMESLQKIVISAWLEVEIFRSFVISPV